MCVFTKQEGSNDEMSLVGLSCYFFLSLTKSFITSPLHRQDHYIIISKPKLWDIMDFQNHWSGPLMFLSIKQSMIQYFKKHCI